MARVFRGVGKDVARGVDGRVGLPEFLHWHPDRKCRALAPQREVDTQEGVEGSVETVGKVALEIVTREF